MGSCFEGLFKKDTMVQSKFKFDGQFKNYNFLKLWNRLHIPLHVGGWLQCSSPIAWPSLPLLKGNFYAFELRASHVQEARVIIFTRNRNFLVPLLRSPLLQLPNRSSCTIVSLLNALKQGHGSSCGWFPLHEENGAHLIWCYWGRRLLDFVRLRPTPYESDALEIKRLIMPLRLRGSQLG